MKRRDFLKRMAFAALAVGVFGDDLLKRSTPQIVSPLGALEEGTVVAWIDTTDRHVAGYSTVVAFDGRSLTLNAPISQPGDYVFRAD